MKKAWKSGLFWSGLSPFVIGVLVPIIVAIGYGLTKRWSITQTHCMIWLCIFVVDIALVLLVRRLIKDSRVRENFDEYCKFWIDASKNTIFPLILLWLSLSLFADKKISMVTGTVNFIYLIISFQKIVFLLIDYSHKVEEDMEKLNIKNVNNNFH